MTIELQIWRAGYAKMLSDDHTDKDIREALDECRRLTIESVVQRFGDNTPEHIDFSEYCTAPAHITANQRAIVDTYILFDEEDNTYGLDIVNFGSDGKFSVGEEESYRLVDSWS